MPLSTAILIMAKSRTLMTQIFADKRRLIKKSAEISVYQRHLRSIEGLLEVKMRIAALSTTFCQVGAYGM